MDEQCVLPEAPLLALGRVADEGAHGRLRLGSRAGERLFLATGDVERLAGNLRAELRLESVVCGTIGVVLLGWCLLMLLLL